MGPIVDVLAYDFEGFWVEICDGGTDAHDVEHDFVDFEHGKDMRASEFVGFALGFLEFEGIKDCLCYIVFLDGLFLSCGVIVYNDEFVPEEVELSANDRGEVVVETEYRARTHDGHIGESLAHYFLCLSLGLEIEGGGVRVSSCSGEVNEAVHSVLSTSLGNAFCHLDIDELKIFPLL